MNPVRTLFIILSSLSLPFLSSCYQKIESPPSREYIFLADDSSSTSTLDAVIGQYLDHCVASVRAGSSTHGEDTVKVVLALDTNRIPDTYHIMKFKLPPIPPHDLLFGGYTKGGVFQYLNRIDSLRAKIHRFLSMPAHFSSYGGMIQALNYFGAREHIQPRRIFLICSSSMRQNESLSLNLRLFATCDSRSTSFVSELYFYHRDAESWAHIPFIGNPDSVNTIQFNQLSE